jgi:archaeosortase A (PGF-CTERM-specific)
MSLWTDPLAWFVLGLFASAVIVERHNRPVGRHVGVAAWTAFAGFWLALLPHFVFTETSIVKAVGSAVAVPACLLVGYHLYRDRDSLFFPTRSIAIMGLIYLSASTISWLYGPLIETTTRQTVFIIEGFGYQPTVLASEEGLRNLILFSTDREQHATLIVFACTGLGSMSIFAGLILAVDAPFRRKLRALAISIPVIWALNLVRTSFIAMAHGKQWFQGVAEQWVFLLFATSDPSRVSYLLADRVISQPLAVLVIVAVFWFVLRELPELAVLVEDAVYIVTGGEYDATRLLPFRPVRSDGGEEDVLAADDIQE